MNSSLQWASAALAAGGLVGMAHAWRQWRREAIAAPALVGAAECREVNFPSRDGQARIAATLLHAAPAVSAVVLVVGQVGCWGSDARVEGRRLHVRTLAQALRSRGITVLVTRLRGHGESERHDVLGAVDHLLSLGYKAGRIGVIGASLGACAALMAAAEEPAIAAVVADSPRCNLMSSTARSPAEVLMPLARWLGRALSGVDLGRRPVLGDLPALRSRAVLVVHGRGDRLVPTSVAQALVQASGASLWLTASHSHAGTLHEALPLYITRVVDFFCQNLPLQRPEPLLLPAQPLEAAA